MSQSACVTANNLKLGNVLQPSILGQQMNRNMQPLQQHNNHFSPQLDQLKADAGFQRAQAGRKSFKRRLQQQHNNLPVRDTQLNCTPTITNSSPSIGTKNSLGPDPPASVARRNARERNRVKQVNTGFAVLRQHIPVLCGSVIVYGGSPQSDGSSSSSSPGGGGGSSSNSKKNKMSKVETLRCAVEYIRNLEKLLATGEGTIDLPAIKEEPLDSLSFIQMAVKQEEENISPDLASTSANDLSGCFYDDSISSGSQSPEIQQQQQHQQRFLFDLLVDDDHAPGSANKRIRAQESASANIKQEMMRSLSSCWPPVRDEDETDGNSLSDLLLDHGQQLNSQQAAAAVINSISDQSLLESINSWWCPNL